jgi:ribosomal protein S18 acetylase RimI-like enzyme
MTITKIQNPKQKNDRSEPVDNQTRILPAGERDGAFIRRLSGKVFAIYGPYGSLVPQWYATGATATIVASVEGVPAGFAMMGPAFQGAFRGGGRPDEAELLAMAVEPEYQRKGLGTLLMQAVEREALHRGVKRIILHTSADNTPAQKLFAGRGFRVHRVSERFYPEGQDALVMSRDMDLPDK